MKEPGILEQRLFDLAIDGFTVIPSVLPAEAVTQIRTEVCQNLVSTTTVYPCYC
jgi:hypothetical protein